jgi:hypothetical protein
VTSSFSFDTTYKMSDPTNTAISKFIEDHKLTSLSLAQLLQKGRDRFKKEEIQSYWTRSRGATEADVDEIHAKKRKQRKEFSITSDPFCCQMDIMFLPVELSRANDRIHKLLVVVDILSRYAWAYPLLGETNSDIIEACTKFVKDARNVRGITADSQFNTQAFKAFWQELGVPTYTVVAADDHLTQSTNRLGIVDTLVKMLRRHITMYMDQNATDRWIDGLPQVLNAHNNLETKELDGRSPEEIYFESDELTLSIKSQEERNRNADVAERVGKTLKVGDLVRVRWAKDKFSKETSVWSREVYRIVEALPFKYLIASLKTGEVERKRFSGQHLLKVRPDSKDVPERPNEEQRKKERGKRRLRREGI